MADITFDQLNTTYGSFDDLTQVLNLLEDISEELNSIFQEEYIEAILVKSPYHDYEEFIAAFEQARQRLDDSIEYYRWNLDNKDNHHSQRNIMNLLYILNDVGFTDAGLKAKESIFRKALDYFKNQGRRTAAKLLSLLTVINDILGSLAIAIPSAHGLDEMKKVAEGAIKVNDLVSDMDSSRKIVFLDDIEIEPDNGDAGKRNYSDKGGKFDL